MFHRTLGWQIVLKNINSKQWDLNTVLLNTCLRTLLLDLHRSLLYIGGSGGGGRYQGSGIFCINSGYGTPVGNDQKREQQGYGTQLGRDQTRNSKGTSRHWGMTKYFVICQHNTREFKLFNLFVVLPCSGDGIWSETFLLTSAEVFHSLVRLRE